MRTLIFLICIAVFQVNEVQAETPDPSVYGTQLDITIPVDVDSLMYNYLENKTKENEKLWSQWWNITQSQHEQVWSPDGKWIAFTGWMWDFLWIVSADGGVPELVFWDYQYETETYYNYNPLMNFCFTPDSQEITFMKHYWDEEKGSIVEGGSRKNGLHYIESVNIYTGDHRFIAEGESSSWSHDGRYLCYLNFDYRIWIDELEADHQGAVTVLDTETGEKRFLTDGSQRCITPQFSPDDQSVIVSMYTKEKTYQLFRIPVNGGEPEQIKFYDSEGDGTGEVFDFDISPDGEWILYSDNNLCLYNLTSEMTYKIFPEPMDPNIRLYFGKFSPDGTKICYGLRDDNTRETRGPFIYIMDIDLEQFTEPMYVEAEQPECVALLSNYPNPFNLSTTIKFTLPESGFTELVIYNITGQKIRELMAQDMPVGVHSVVWDGNDENGIPVSSGVFVSRLTSGENVVSNRMMLVK